MDESTMRKTEETFQAKDAVVVCKQLPSRDGYRVYPSYRAVVMATTERGYELGLSNGETHEFRLERPEDKEHRILVSNQRLEELMLQQNERASESKRLRNRVIAAWREAWPTGAIQPELA